MLTLKDCMDFGHLTSDQIDALTAHEHRPAMVVAEWAEGLMESQDGCREIVRILIDEIAHSYTHGDAAQIARFEGALRDFLAEYRGHPPGH